LNHQHKITAKCEFPNISKLQDPKTPLFQHVLLEKITKNFRWKSLMIFMPAVGPTGMTIPG
jgi:hypothetical protein